MQTLTRLFIVLVIGVFLAAGLRAQEKTEVLPEEVAEILDQLRTGKKIKGLKLGTASPNERPGMEFFRTGRLKPLRLGVSTRVDVSKIFGSACAGMCDYDEKWKFKVEYFQTGASLSDEPASADQKTAPRKLVLRPENAGKIYAVHFIPKIETPIETSAFAAEFHMKFQISFGDDFDGHSSRSLILSYTDGYGLRYRIDRSDTKKYPGPQTGDLIRVEYTIPREPMEELFAEQKPAAQ